MELCDPETKQQGTKRNVAFRDTIPVLGVYKERGFYGKEESDPKPTTTLSNFKKQTSTISYKERKNHGKEHASVRNLGTWLDTNLTMSAHVKKNVPSCYLSSV